MGIESKIVSESHSIEVTIEKISSIDEEDGQVRIFTESKIGDPKGIILPLGDFEEGIILPDIDEGDSILVTYENGNPVMAYGPLIRDDVYFFKRR